MFDHSVKRCRITPTINAHATIQLRFHFHELVQNTLRVFIKITKWHKGLIQTLLKVFNRLVARVQLLQDSLNLVNTFPNSDNASVTNKRLNGTLDGVNALVQLRFAIPNGNTNVSTQVFPMTTNFIAHLDPKWIQCLGDDLTNPWTRLHFNILHRECVTL